MTKGIDISIAADTRSAMSAITKGLIDPLEDASEALELLGRDGKGAGDDLEKGMRDAQRETKEAKSEIRDLRDEVQKAGKAARQIGDDSKAGFSDFKDEASSSGREAAASFGGGFEDVADFAQETLANALGGFGPLGAAAGVALAAVLGTALSSAAAAQEKLTAAREAAGELASTLYENGGTIPMQDRIDELFAVLSRESKPNGQLQSMVDQWADFGSVMDDIRGVAEKTGRPVDELIRALSGDDLDSTRENLARVNDELDRLSDWTPVWDEQYQSLTGYKTELEATIKSQEMASDLVNSADFLKTKRVEDLTQAWNDAGVAASNYFKEGEDGATTFDVGAYIADWEAQIARADEVKADLLTLPASIREEAERQWATGGVAAADAYVDAYQAADGDTKARLEAIAGPQGQAAGRAAAAGFVSAADAGTKAWKPSDLLVRIGVDDSAVRNWRPPMKAPIVVPAIVGRLTRNGVPFE
jgi:hypothetical protein